MKLQKHKETIAIIQFLVQSRWETTVVDVVGDQKVRGGKKASSSSSQTSFSPPSVNNTKLFSSVVVDTFSKLKRQVIKKKNYISGCSHPMGIFQSNTGSSLSWWTKENFCVTQLQGVNPSQ